MAVVAALLVALVTLVGPTQPATAASTPSAPRLVTLLTGSSQVTVSWFVPLSDGGSPITDYQVSIFNSNGGPAVGVIGSTVRLVGSPTRSLVFTGLPNHFTYRFQVAAINAVGTGPSSPMTTSIMVGAPTPPRWVKTSLVPTATLTGNLWVWFLPPLSDNGQPVTGYTATCTSSNGGVTRSASRSISPIAVGWLTTGRAYTCRVTAQNGRGTSAPSAPTAVAYVGGAGTPTNVGAVSVGGGTINVTFTQGASNGSGIIDDTATCTSSDGGAPGTGLWHESPVPVTGLTVGKHYRCTVVARNRRGPSPPSAPSPLTTA